MTCCSLSACSIAAPLTPFQDWKIDLDSRPPAVVQVLVLKESSEMREVAVLEEPQASTPGSSPLDLISPSLPSQLGEAGQSKTKIKFTWRIENFVSFKDIMETRKIFSRYFKAGPCELRLGVYESFDTLCIYLESDALAGELERNFWVKYRQATPTSMAAEFTTCKGLEPCPGAFDTDGWVCYRASETVDYGVLAAPVWLQNSGAKPAAAGAHGVEGELHLHQVLEQQRPPVCQGLRHG